MDTLETLLVVYMVLLILNAGVSFLLWFNSRNSIFMYLMGVWSFTLVNFLTQTVTLTSEIASVFAFSSYIFVAWCLVNILTRVTQDQYSFNRWWYTWGASLVITGIVILTVEEPNFFLLSMPIAIAVALPQIVAAGRFLAKREQKQDSLIKAFAIVLLINGIHFLDYPILRPIPESAVFGYSVVIGTSMLFGIFLPCITTGFLAKKLSRQLIQEIDTRRSTEKRLESALFDAERSSNAKTIFLANMSHEIRTPINGIVGLNDLMLKTELTNQQLTYVRQIKKSSNILLSIVNNILDLSKLESSTVLVSNSPFLIRTLCDDVMNHYKTIGINNVELKVNIEDCVPQCMISDEEKIKQICFNLVNNALKHANASVISIQISFADNGVSGSTKGLLTIKVVDDGIGIPEEKIVQYTRRFEQAEYSSKDGAGLGISIVSELVCALKGDFSIDSDTGQGVRALFSIPVERSEYVEEQNKVVNIESCSNNFDIKKVLVVEDNLVNLMVLEGMLQNIGVEYVTAKTYEEARSAYFETPNTHFSLIFMDVQLPDGNGLDLTAKIREAGHDLPIIVVSAFAYDEDVSAALNAGATSYLKKPFTSEELSGILDQYYFVGTASDQPLSHQNGQ